MLSRYVGWGGVPEAFDPSKTAWAKEYAELKELLTPGGIRRCQDLYSQRPLHQPYGDPRYL